MMTYYLHWSQHLTVPIKRRHDQAILNPSHVIFFQMAL